MELVFDQRVLFRHSDEKKREKKNCEIHQRVLYVAHPLSASRSTLEGLPLSKRDGTSRGAERDGDTHCCERINHVSL